MLKKLFFLLWLSVLFIPTANVKTELEDDLVTMQESTDDFVVEYFIAEAISVTNSTLDIGGPVLQQQIVARALNGTFKGQELDFFQRSVYGIEQVRYVKPGDVLILVYSSINTQPYQVVTHYRIPQIMFLIAVFVAFICWLTARRGVRAIIALSISFALLYTIALPLIRDGYPALLILSVTASVILLLSIFTAHGFKRKSFIAGAGGLISIIFAAIIGWYSILVLRLNGTGVSEADFLQFGNLSGISLRGLLLGGIIISTVGILDDVTTVQTITVNELLKANPSLTKKELYKHAMVIGREHIISMVNTLFIVFAGTTIPIFLYYIFDSTNMPLWVKLNSDNLVEEFTRSLAGSFALVLAVPITTLLAAHFFTKTSQRDTSTK